MAGLGAFGAAAVVVNVRRRRVPLPNENAEEKRISRTATPRPDPQPQIAEDAKPKVQGIIIHQIDVCLQPIAGWRLTFVDAGYPVGGAQLQCKNDMSEPQLNILVEDTQLQNLSAQAYADKSRVEVARENLTIIDEPVESPSVSSGAKGGTPLQESSLAFYQPVFQHNGRTVLWRVSNHVFVRDRLAATVQLLCIDETFAVHQAAFSQLCIIMREQMLQPSPSLARRLQDNILRFTCIGSQPNRQMDGFVMSVPVSTRRFLDPNLIEQIKADFAGCRLILGLQDMPTGGSSRAPVVFALIAHRNKWEVLMEQIRSWQKCGQCTHHGVTTRVAKYTKHTYHIVELLPWQVLMVSWCASDPDAALADILAAQATVSARQCSSNHLEFVSTSARVSMPVPLPWKSRASPPLFLLHLFGHILFEVRPFGNAKEVAFRLGIEPLSNWASLAKWEEQVMKDNYNDLTAERNGVTQDGKRYHILSGNGMRYNATFCQHGDYGVHVCSSKEGKANLCEEDGRLLQQMESPRMF